MFEIYKNYKIKVSTLKHSLYEANYVHEKDGLRSNKKGALCIETQALYSIYNIILPIGNNQNRNYNWLLLLFSVKNNLPVKKMLIKFTWLIYNTRIFIIYYFNAILKM